VPDKLDLLAVEIEDLEGVVDYVLDCVGGGGERAARVDYAAYIRGKGTGYVVGCQGDGFVGKVSSDDCVENVI